MRSPRSALWIPFVLSCCLAALPSGCASSARAAGALRESPAAHEQRMQWWRDARFGLFIHWGLYSIPAGKWGSSTQHGEWIRETAQIPLEQYEPLQAQFKPVHFEPAEWMRLARRAGMRYVVITSKHHDGFGLWDSALTDWDMGGTPSKRDLLGELRQACLAEGLRFCTYHSIMDWHHPDYLPRRAWEQRSAEGADFARYVRFLHGQVAELITRYHPSVLWFDGEWESTWSHALGVELYQRCRELDPQLIVNNRVDVHRAGMNGFSSSDDAVGDFGTPEQEVPAQGVAGVDWESCMTMNANWGYNAADTHWKSVETLVRTLIDVASKGGNFLLNVGPRADGTLPPEAVQRLEGIARWMELNGEAIHGTQANPLEPLAWGRCTMKRVAGGTRLYLHIFDWPADGWLLVPGLGNEARGASLLAAPGQPLRVERRGDALAIELGRAAPDAIASVLALDIAGAPIVYRAPAILAPTSLIVGSATATLESGAKELELRYTLDGREPTLESALYRKPLELRETCTLKARAFHKGRAVSPIAARDFVWTLARPGATEVAAGPSGANLYAEEGSFDHLPDLPAQPAGELELVAELALPPELRREHVAAEWFAQMYVPETAAWLFELTSDDGSRLWIDEVLAVDHDGLHSASPRLGEVALGKGWHRLRIAWFNQSGGAELALKRARAGEKLAPIPAEHLRAAAAVLAAPAAR